MRIFFTILKKEVLELLNWQFLLPLVITAVLFLVMGNVMSQEQERAQEPQKVLVTDLDKSAASATLIDTLRKANFNPQTGTTAEQDALVAEAKDQGASVALVIPQGFGEGIAQGTQQHIESYSLVRNFSFISNRSSLILDQVLSAVNSYFSKQLVSTNTALSADAVLAPITLNQYVSVSNRTAKGTAQDVLGYVGAQTTFIPIILFIVIMTAAQMIATAISSEKENKTLETLLTLPIPRTYIVAAKMLAAGLVALLSAVVYMVGFRKYMNGITGGGLNQISDGARATVEQLGLRFTGTDYIFLGASLFLGILVALAIAMILGSFAEDVKSVQGLITPLMIMIMIPYLVTLLLDVDRLSTPVKTAFYAIPFSHTFMAAPNLLLQQTTPVFMGIGYLAICFIIFLMIAAKIFTTDRIITMKVNFSKKKAKTA